MGTEVDAARAEIDAAIATITPQLAGLRDYDRLELTPPSRGVIEQSIAQYTRRLEVLNAAAAALEALDGDGYPGIPIREIPNAVFVELKTLLSAESAAFATFESDIAERFGETADKPVFKTP